MLRRGRVLIVDDDETLARFLKRALRVDYDIALAPDGRAALDRIKSGERYDLILCDLQMPEMTGVDFLMNLDELAAEQVGRIVFVTANPQQPMARLVSGHVLIDKVLDCTKIAEIAARHLRDRAA